MNFINKIKVNKKMTLLILIPIVAIVQYYLFKFGIISPVVKGVEIHVEQGDIIQEIDKYVMKLDDTVKLSPGEYIMVPSYAKESNIWFNVLDDSGVIEIKGNKMTAKKEGFSSIAVMKDSRILKKATIRVVSQSVENIDVELSNNINYVGDTATINTLIDVYYDFDEKPEIIYESSNENIIQVNGDEIKAVGVGSASLYVKSLNKQHIITFNDIQVRVSDIKMNDTELEVGEQIKLNPMIYTSPRGFEHPPIKYEIYGEDKGIIQLSDNGNVLGLKEGTQKIKIRCGYIERIFTITVVKESISNKIITNLESIFEFIEDKLNILLSWDMLEGVEEYNIYIKDNLEDEDYKLFESLDKDQYKIDKEKVSREIKIKSKENYDFSLYVTGVNSKSETKASNIINIKSENNIIDDLKVENLSYKINDELRNITLNWDKINELECTYDIYIKNNLIEDSGFELYSHGIQENTLSIDLGEENIDIDIYVVAKYKDKYSKKSDIINATLNELTEDIE